MRHIYLSPQHNFSIFLSHPLKFGEICWWECFVITAETHFQVKSPIFYNSPENNADKSKFSSCNSTNVNILDFENKEKSALWMDSMTVFSLFSAKLESRESETERQSSIFYI